MAKKDKLRELNLTPEQRAGVEKYIEWINAKRRASRLNPLYAEIDRQFPELSPDVREELADTMYNKQMSDIALKRSAPRGA